jgi:hypothetical protein
MDDVQLFSLCGVYCEWVVEVRFWDGMVGGRGDLGDEAGVEILGRLVR